MNQSICIRCEKPVPDDSQYCNHCGTRLPAVRTPKSSPTLPASSPFADPKPQLVREPELEPTLWLGRCSQVRYLGATGTPAAALIAAALVANWLSLISLLALLSGILTVVLLGAGAAILLAKRQGRLYRLTPRRLLLHRGLVFSKRKEMDLEDVIEVIVRQSSLQSLLGVGDLFVYSSQTSSQANVVRGVVNPVYVREKIHGLAEELREKSRKRLGASNFPSRP